MDAWVCLNCGCSPDFAQRRQRHLGLPPHRVAAKTCTSTCARAYAVAARQRARRTRDGAWEHAQWLAALRAELGKNPATL